MKRVYVAGKYSANNVLDVLRNIGRGRLVCAKLFEAGFAPFCPWHDSTYVVDNPEGDFESTEKFKHASIKWLEVSDAMYVISKSDGVNSEIDKARELGIPVFFDFESLMIWSVT